MASTLSLSAPSGAVRFASWNVKSLNSPIKRNKVINHIKPLNTKIVFLQETHLKPLDHVKLGRGWVGQLFNSSFSSKACWVANSHHLILGGDLLSWSLAWSFISQALCWDHTWTWKIRALEVRTSKTQVPDSVNVWCPPKFIKLTLLGAGRNTSMSTGPYKRISGAHLPKRPERGELQMAPWQGAVADVICAGIQ